MDTLTLLDQIDQALTDAQTTAQEMEDIYTRLTQGNEDQG